MPFPVIDGFLRLASLVSEMGKSFVSKRDLKCDIEFFFFLLFDLILMFAFFSSEIIYRLGHV